MPFQYRDPSLTTADAVQTAAQILYSRLTPGRTMIEWESDLLILSGNNRPLWLGDVVQLYQPDGVTAQGVYRIIAIPSIDFEQENVAGNSTLFNVRRAVYRAVDVS